MFWTYDLLKILIIICFNDFISSTFFKKVFIFVYLVDKLLFCDIFYPVMTDFVLKDEIFFHGTRARFERFRPLSHFGSWESATDILASSSTIKKEKLDGLTEIKNPNKTSKTIIPDSIIISAKLNIHNTYEIQDFASCHDLKSYNGFVLRHIAHDLKINGTPKFFDYIFSEPFKMPYQDVQNDLRNDNLYTPEFEEIDRYHLSFQRVIQYFESLGYDGFHYVNQYEDRGHISYIVFRPENIIRTDIKTEHFTQKPQSTFVPELIPIRKQTSEEIVRLHCENINHDDLFEQKVNRIKSQIPPEQANKIKAHYAKIFYNDIWPKIKHVSRQSIDAHGLTHTEQTVLHGIDIAIVCAHNPLPVILACVLYDAFCDGNKKNTIPFAKKFISENYPRLHRNTVEEIIGAIKHIDDNEIARRDLTAACMWDAKRIHMAWNGQYKKVKLYCSTSVGRQMAELGADAQAQYIQIQDEFLARHGLKFPKQITTHTMNQKYR